ncbi:MAG TPA: GNVR domain-containing protein [bacterium]|nr:GNVR domain-containing protein [bacterium]HPN45234.1 GNVR domain-containing protein [bacterium]
MNKKPTEKQDAAVTEIHLLDLLGELVDARMLLLRNFIVTITLILSISFLLPRKYMAETTLMPPQEAEKSAMSGIISELSMPGVGLPLTSTTSSEMMTEILKSRSVNELVLQREFTVKDKTLPLYKHLKFRSVEKGLLRIGKYTRFFVSKQGIITVAAEMRNPQLAADVANAYVEELDRINRVKSVSRAKNSRIYIESQLQETNAKLLAATKELAHFQQQNKAVSLQDQMKASIQQAGELKGQIIAKEVQIGVMLQTMKKENPLVIRAQKELDEMNRRYKELQYGQQGDEQAEGEFYVPFTDVPEVGLKLAELTREVKVQETVWELLNQQYYQAKIEEARNTPTVQVLDYAEPPVIPSWPRKKLLVIVFGLLSILLTMIWIFMRRSYRQSRPDDKERLQGFIAEFKKDWQAMKNKIPHKK